MIVVIGLLVAFVLVLLFSSPQTRQCRWRADRTGDRGEERKFVCAACGAVAYTGSGKPPDRCEAKGRGA